MKLINNNRGFMVERILFPFLIIIAAAVGISQYQKHGIIGFILGFIITIGGVVLTVFLLIGLLDRIGYIHDRLHKKMRYRNTLKIFGLIFIFLFLSLWTAALLGIATLRFEVLKKMPEPAFSAVALTAGGVATAMNWFLKSAFWHYF